MRLWKKATELLVTHVLRIGKNASMKVQAADGTWSDVSITELGVLDGLTATTAEINTIADGITATAAEVNAQLDASALDTMAPSTVMDATVTYASKVTTDPTTGVIHTQIYVDLTGAKSTTTLNDIIGDTGACHIGQITAAINGAIFDGRMTCLEVPAGGVTDIDLSEASVDTGAYDADVSALTNYGALLSKGGAWTAAAPFAGTDLTGLPTADYYLYLSSGVAGTADTYTAGKFLIEFWGI